MKNFELKSFTIFAVMLLSSKVHDGSDVNAMTHQRQQVIPLSEIVPRPMEPIVVNELNPFLESIGHKESGNRYDIVNTYGYMGKYQFGPATLRGLGYDLTREEFLNHPELQEKAMLDLLKHNKKKLQKYIDKYDGEVVHGVYITESGILAAAHLGGQGNVKKFFRRGQQFRDGYGTTITSYMEKFAGYNLELD
jgi:hypothetical protein